jgi:hypothetical protein
MRARKALVAAVALALGGALVAGCSADGRAVSSGATSSGVSSTATPTPEETETVPATVSPPLPQPVGSVTKVKRQGQPATPSVSAPAVAFSKPVRYPDGVRLDILKAEKGTETGHGPGVMAGREYVRFQLRLTNGSSKPINLNEVVVTTFYSAKRQLAAPVYTESAKTFDFSGTVAAGKSATAYYAFAVPTSDLGRVTMVVDFDGLHTSATYSGAVVAS